MKKTAYLVLENGRVFEGTRFGAEAEVVGELVFTTSMTGYLETITDPSFCGQIVMQTFPLIGNYGVIPGDFESAEPLLSAYVVREWCQEPSNFRSVEDLDTFLKEKNVCGLYGVDTRELTKMTRTKGVMNAMIADDPQAALARLEEIKAYQVTGAVEKATCKEVEILTPENPTKKVVLYDFGAKKNISRELMKRGCQVIRVPSWTTAKEALSYEPDGLMLSNGPGDPEENAGVIAQLKELMPLKLPTFGICLGHQLFALAAGAETKKLKYGHRGANQPVKDLATSRLYMTSQNHGYEVIASTLPEGAKESFVNANDGTCEGVDYPGLRAFTVQFHPEACAGPQDTGFLFDRFISMMEE